MVSLPFCIICCQQSEMHICLKDCSLQTHNYCFILIQSVFRILTSHLRWALFSSCVLYFELFHLFPVILCINVCMFSLIPPLVAMLQWTCVCDYSYGSKSPSAAAAAFHWAIGADVAHYQPGLCHSVAVHPHHGSCRHCIFSRLVYRMSHCLDRHSAVNVAGDCEMSMRLFVLVYRLNVIVVWVFCCT